MASSMPSKLVGRGSVRADAGAAHVLVVDDHRLVAHGLALALRQQGYRAEFVAPREVDHFVDELPRGPRPVVVLLDLHFSTGLGGLALVGPLRRAGARVLVLAEWECEQDLLAAVEAGAVGWVQKSARFEDLIDAVERAVRGLSVGDAASLGSRLEIGREARAAARARAVALSTLTPREAEVLDMLVLGLAAREIADTAVVSLATVRTQIASILRKLGVRSQLAAVAAAHAAGGQPRPLPRTLSARWA